MYCDCGKKASISTGIFTRKHQCQECYDLDNMVTFAVHIALLREPIIYLSKALSRFHKKHNSEDK